MACQTVTPTATIATSVPSRKSSPFPIGSVTGSGAISTPRLVPREYRTVAGP